MCIRACVLFVLFVDNVRTLSVALVVRVNLLAAADAGLPSVAVEVAPVGDPAV